jgi:hypothetical protein
MTYFEDLRIGTRAEVGSHTFTADEIRAFAREFDPQPFHLDEEAAAGSHFGALCASGWHTAAVCLRHVVLARQRQQAELRRRGEPVARIGPSPGLRDLKWPRPVYVGDTIAPLAGPMINSAHCAVRSGDCRTAPGRHPVRCRPARRPPHRHQPAGRAGLFGAKQHLHRAASVIQTERKLNPATGPQDRRRTEERVGRNKRSAMRRFISNRLAEVRRDVARLSHENSAMRGVYHRAGQRPDPVAYCVLRPFNRSGAERSTPERGIGPVRGPYSRLPGFIDRHRAP